VTALSQPKPVRWTFLLPGLTRPAGGLIAAYELAQALAARGRDVVRIVHFPTPEGRLQSTSDIPWFTFGDVVAHDFLADLDPGSLPDGDVLVYTVMAIDRCLDAAEDPAARRLLDQLQAPESPAGLPILFLQALGVFSEPTEMCALAGAGPKVCVASWIADNLVRGGLPDTEVVWIVNGVDLHTFRVTHSIADRGAQVAMNFNPHPLKNMGAGLKALERIDRDLGVPSVVYGSRVPEDLPAGVTFVRSPRQKQVSEEILARSSVYLQPSTQEGFGLCALEAMACGCALVTTDNGGSADYARHGETAIVCATEPDAMADAIGALLHDADLRVRIATNGADYAKQFTWARGAARLTELADAYLADPGSFRRRSGARLDPSVRTLRV
jgi:glycosyltransferase involved in cell wall biosynthesis